MVNPYQRKRISGNVFPGLGEMGQQVPPAGQETVWDGMGFQQAERGKIPPNTTPINVQSRDDDASVPKVPGRQEERRIPQERSMGGSRWDEVMRKKNTVSIDTWKGGETVEGRAVQMYEDTGELLPDSGQPAWNRAKRDYVNRIEMVTGSMPLQNQLAYVGNLRQQLLSRLSRYHYLAGRDVRLDDTAQTDMYRIQNSLEALEDYMGMLEGQTASIGPAPQQPRRGETRNVIPRTMRPHQMGGL